MLSSADTAIVVLPLRSAQSGQGVATATPAYALSAFDARWLLVGSVQCGQGAATAMPATALSFAASQFPSSPSAVAPPPIRRGCRHWWQHGCCCRVMYLEGAFHTMFNVICVMHEGPKTCLDEP